MAENLYTDEDNNIFVTPIESIQYRAGENITISATGILTGDNETIEVINYTISGKNWTPEISKKQDKLLFEYNDNDAISSINGSALAEKTYSAGDNIDITNDVISVTGLSTYTPGQMIQIKNDIIDIKNNNCSATGNFAVAIGFQTFANGPYSYAEGDESIASGKDSHAEGEKTSAFGTYSHAEGQRTLANKDCTHAEGCATSALGYYSHAEGIGTIVSEYGMHVGGKYNKTSAGALFVIGNGIDSLNKSDAFIIYPNGSVSATGKISANGVELGAGGGGDYVPLSATNVAVGKNNTAEYCAFAQGSNNNAQKNGVAIGAANTADLNSFTQGEYCVGNTRGLAQGSSATAYTNSFSQGESTYASNGSLAQGLGVSATQYSIAQGNDVSSNNHAQAFGEGIRISGGMAIGKYNNTTAASFVIGNGANNANRSDLFIIKNDGTVSGTGNIYASGGQVVTDVMLTSAVNSSASFVTNGVADLTSLYTYIKSLEDRIAALEAALGNIETLLAAI